MNGYPAAIIWDLDGTLIDSAPDLAQALNTLLREHGYAGIEEDQVQAMIGDGVPQLIERGFRAAGIAMRGHQAIILNSDHEMGTVVPIDLAALPTAEEAMHMAIRLGGLPSEMP